MKVFKALALVSLSALGAATVQADEPVKTMPQTGGVTQATYTESGRSHKLFGRNRHSDVVQVSGSTTTTSTTTTKQLTPSTTTAQAGTTTTTGKTTTVTQQPVAQRQHRGLFGKHRTRYTTSTTATPTTSTTGSTDAKPLPLGK